MSHFWPADLFKNMGTVINSYCTFSFLSCLSVPFHSAQKKCLLAIMLGAYRISHIQVLGILSIWSSCTPGRYLIHRQQEKMRRLDLDIATWSIYLQCMVKHVKYYCGHKRRGSRESVRRMTHCTWILWSS